MKKTPLTNLYILLITTISLVGMTTLCMMSDTAKISFFMICFYALSLIGMNYFISDKNKEELTKEEIDKEQRGKKQ